MVSQQAQNKIKDWFFERVIDSKHDSQHKEHWLNVMCLTGVDYFSSLGFAPAMAFLYAGLLSPFATALLVLLNLFGAFPMYAKVAEQSPHGQGSISMLQNLLPKWWGKLLIICLLGFAATDFMMTITLCASDAAKHVVENPYAPLWLKNQMANTLCLVTLLGAVFIKGFKEAIKLAVFLVWIYLSLTLVVIIASFFNMQQNPSLQAAYFSNLFLQHAGIWHIVAVSFLTFPRLALGMSGFETGVAVMPQIRGDSTDTEENPQSRIKRTKYLLLTAAIIMSFFLLASSYVTTVQIPQAEFAPEGSANGRALAYLAHELLGNNFGTVNNIISRAEGLHVASVFIAFIIFSSFLSRCIRSTELRIGHVELNLEAQSHLDHLLTHHHGEIRLLAHRPGGVDYKRKESEAREFHSIQPPEGDFIFLEVSPSDTSDFQAENLFVKGEIQDGFRVWKCESPSVPNAIAGILLHVRDKTDKVPHIYFGWTEGHPVWYVIKYILWGEGETAPVTREILRSSEHDPKKRPRVHVS